MKKMLCTALFCTFSFLVSMDVAIRVSVDEEQFSSQFKTDSIVPFSVQLSRSLLNTWNGTVLCKIKCGGESIKKKLSIDSSFSLLFQKIIANAMLKSDVAMIEGVITAEQGSPRIEIKNMKIGSKQIAKKERELEWGTAVRYYFNKALHVEIFVDKAAPVIKKCDMDHF